MDPLTGAMWTLAPEPTADAGETEEQAAPPRGPVAQSGDTYGTVNERLEALKQRRVKGEISGDEYLAERQRIINGQ